MRRSLVELGLADAARVYCSRVEKALDMVEGPYDLVLADPPYELDPWAEVMERLDGRRLLREGALVMAEHGRRRELDLAYEGMVRVTSRRYGDTSISIYKATSRDA